MAYNGYRLKINSAVFNDSYIAKGSYSCQEAKRVVRAWTDGNGITHEEYAATPRATIKFKLREHNSNNHATLMTLLQGGTTLTVEFYNDLTDTYRTGSFKLETISFSHKNLGGAGIIYNSADITLTER